ncbi:hypothetical protein [Pseudoflavonifractor sp. HCP28S3_F10]|uniref:hypothetical protein n=1 Tax=Pseudoflavonifractor sp. HCP28S3_F10 TaxID=3438947 RepID=UPI003F8C6F38
MRNKYQGKRALSRWPKGTAAALALLLTAAVAVGGTLAWITAHTEPIVNTFEVGSIVPGITEEFDNTTKSDVKVTNTGSVPAYVRVALVYSWRDGATAGKNPADTGAIVGEPVTDADLTIDWGDSTNWVKGSDGYWYYKLPVAAGSPTSNLIDSLTVSAASENGKLYNLDLQILVDAIQAEPDSAVESVWPVTVNTDLNGVKTLSANP